ncbi:hypothetical protein [Actinoplanes sp. NPDC049265]|uniref:hypothetical protein n=1 Tax=Actinoplanes sp. NPDC049265 TaxID=3363902 RepID=UPI003720AE04
MLAGRVIDIRRAVRWGTWMTGGVLLLVLYRSQALAGYRPAYLASVGAWAGAAGLLAWPHPPPRLRRVLTGVLAAVTLTATAALTHVVPTTAQHTTANWAVGANGWLLLTLASGGRVTLVLLLLAAPVMFAEGAALSAGGAEVVLTTARGLGVLGLQVPIALAATTVERSARVTRALRLAREALRTDQFVAAALHDDRLRRSHAVAAAVEPVLASLADPAPGHDPDRDETLRWRSGVAAAQVRRLMAQWHRADGDPLGDDLSACLDDVQAVGARVEVAVHTGGLPPALRRAACDVVRRIADRPVTRLRLTAVLAASHVSLSVVARTSGGDGFALEVPAPLTIRTTSADGMLWVEVRCPV